MKMYRTTILVFAASIFMACNSGEHQHSGDVHNEATTVTGDQHENESGLSLNNGQKWQADASTNENVKSMQQVVDDFKASGKTGLNDYLNTGSELRIGIDKMISECRMQGADHDALHKWLEPLMQMTKELNDAKDETAASAAFVKVHDQLAMYNTYFE